MGCKPLKTQVFCPPKQDCSPKGIGKETTRNQNDGGFGNISSGPSFRRRVSLGVYILPVCREKSVLHCFRRGVLPYHPFDRVAGSKEVWGIFMTHGSSSEGRDGRHRPRIFPQVGFLEEREATSEYAPTPHPKASGGFRMGDMLAAHAVLSLATPGRRNINQSPVAEKKSSCPW